MAEKIRYEIDVDASDAEAELKNLGRAGAQAGKAIDKGLSQAGRSVPKVRDTLDDVVDILDDVESKAKQAANQLVQMATKSDAELRQAAAAAEALKTELGQSADKFDIDKAVGKLNKLGLSFEEIEADAKMLAETMKRVDDIEMRRVNDGITTTNASMGRLRDSSDQSRSVMANLAGNAAQDLGQLGGVVGSLGVGIGQLAEYAVDGNIALGNLAKIAGPMAGLAFGLAAVQDIMGAISKQKAFKKEQVLDFTEALRDGQTILGEIYDTIDETNQLLFETGPLQGGGLFGLGGESEDLIDTFNELGLSAEEVLGILSDPSKATAALDELGDKAFETAKQFDVGSAERDAWEQRSVLYHDAADGMEVFGASAEEAADKAKLIGEILEPELIRDFRDAVAEIDFDPMESGIFRTLVDDIRDGEVNLANFDKMVQGLADSWGISTEKVREYLLQNVDEEVTDDAAALEEAAAAALEYAQAVADLGDTIAEVDTDDAANIASGLEEALGEASTFIDHLSFAENLQHELNDALGEAERFGPDLRELLDLQAAGVEITPDITLGDLESDDAEFLGWVSSLQNMIQGGAVEAFETGGIDAANAFVQAQAAAIAGATGLDIAEVYRLMGLPADGALDMILKPVVDAEAKADALAIIDSLIGVDPNNPALAYLRLAVQADTVPAEIAEIAARILASQATGLPIELEGVTQEEIDAALAVIATYDATVPVRVDDGGTVQDTSDDIDEATEDRTTQVIVPKSDSLGAMQTLIDHVARAREVAFNSKADNAGAIDRILDSVAADRNAEVWVKLPNIWDAEQDLATLARNRTATITVNRVGGATPTAGPTADPTAGPMAGPMAFDEDGTPAPTAAPSISAVTMAAPVPSPTVIVEPRVTVQAGVIGNPHAVSRAVRKALQQSYRINGRRRVA